jgi:hypothetical protein
MEIVLEEPMHALLIDVAARHGMDVRPMLSGERRWRLEPHEKGALLEAISHEFAFTGVDEDDEPNARGLQLKALLDLLKDRGSMRPDLGELLDRYSEEFADFAGIYLEHANQAGIGGEDRPLHTAAYAGLTDDIRILLREGADIHAAGSIGLTPLHCAAMKGHVAAVELLLQSGADPAATDEVGDPALMWARNLGHPEVVRILEAALQASRLTKK